MVDLTKIDKEKRTLHWGRKQSKEGELVRQQDILHSGFSAFVAIMFIDRLLSVVLRFVELSLEMQIWSQVGTLVVSAVIVTLLHAKLTQSQLSSGRITKAALLTGIYAVLSLKRFRFKEAIEAFQATIGLDPNLSLAVIAFTTFVLTFMAMNQTTKRFTENVLHPEKNVSAKLVTYGWDAWYLRNRAKVNLLTIIIVFVVFYLYGTYFK
ncbi:MAG: hypothetical protein GOV15_00545 [Candidatus Diapherotrites archaeon]|nr:hypothetical protein [Candidatus Diapherotrites archaeon]